MEFYCMKCKKKKKVEKYETVTKQGRRPVKLAVAVCPDCGTKIYRILPSE